MLLEQGTGSCRQRRIIMILLWLAVITGLAVSAASLIEELCMATACSDAASFVFFGIGMAVLGCAYFSLMLVLLVVRKKSWVIGWIFTGMVFSGVGAEFRLLWIQKFIIGSWCPLCVTICCALFVSAVLLLVERVLEGREAGNKVNMAGWLSFVTVMIAIGLVVAIIGVRALT